MALQPKTQAAPRPRVGRGDAPPLTPLRQPQLFIRIVTAAEADLVRAIAGQHALEHLHRQERAEGKVVKTLVVRQFANDGTAFPQDPELSRRRYSIQIIYAEAQRAELAGEPDQRGDKVGK